MPTMQEILDQVQRSADAAQGRAGKPGIGVLGQSLQNDPYYIKSILQALMSASGAIRPGAGAIPQPNLVPRINPPARRDFTSREINEMGAHPIHTGPNTAELAATEQRGFLGSGYGNLNSRTALRPRFEPSDTDRIYTPEIPAFRPKSEVEGLVQNHYGDKGPHRNRTEAWRASRRTAITNPPENPVTLENLIPMMDRYGLSYVPGSGNPYRAPHGSPGGPEGTRYPNFVDRQGRMQFHFRRPNLEQEPRDPNFIVRIPNPNDPHPAGGLSQNRRAVEAGRFFDTAYRHGRDYQMRPELTRDALGRPLAELHNLEWELARRHFRDYMPQRTPRQPSSNRDSRQLHFLDILDALSGAK